MGLGRSHSRDRAEWVDEWGSGVKVGRNLIGGVSDFDFLASS